MGLGVSYERGTPVLAVCFSSCVCRTLDSISSLHSVDYEPFTTSHFPDEINFMAVWGIVLARNPSRFGGNETFVINGVGDMGLFLRMSELSSGGSAPEHPCLVPDD